MKSLRGTEVDREPCRGEAVEAWRRELVRALGEDAAEAERPVPAPVARAELLTFELGDEVYGIDIQAVVEILTPRPITPLPRAPSFVAGVAGLRGAVIPVLDMAARLGVGEGAPGRGMHIVVLRDEDEAMGFRVDRVRGVVRLGGDEVRPHDLRGAVDPVFLTGVGYDRTGTLIAVLSADALCRFEVEGGR